MNEVLAIEGSDCWPEEHCFIIGMSCDKEKMMLFLYFSASFVEVHHSKGEEIESK